MKFETSILLLVLGACRYLVPVAAPPPPTEAPGPVSGGGSGGDPHFTTWTNQHYDFHGHCDLVLVKNQSFRNGKGISIHIRSSEYKTFFSYISAVAVKIGDDILEVGGDGTHYVNGIAQAPLKSLGRGRFRITYKENNVQGLRRIYKIGLDAHTAIVIRVHGEWIRVQINNAKEKDFQSSVGLMGSFQDGTLLGRDDETAFTSINDFGMEWQVHEDLDGQLFQTPSPYPDKCNMPSEADMPSRRRRLSESTVSEEDAVRACSQWGKDGLKDCVMDVLVSDNLAMADLGPF